jgi:hypothetical protein
MLRNVHAHSNAAGVSFIFVELELGLTFCQIALRTNSERAAQRNTQNAFKAYSAAVHYVKKVGLTADQWRDFDYKESRLRALLAQLT